MPTIDTSTIEGFDAMTAEDKVAALLKVDIPDKVDMSAFIAKSQYDKVSSELADAKKTIRAKQTDEEAAKAQEAADRKALEDKYNELLKSSTIANHTAKFLALGYDEKLARATAEALFDGDMDKVFANQQTFNEGYKKRIEAELVKQNPLPGGAGGGGEEKDTNVEYARQLGKQRAASMQASNDVLNKFKIGK